MPTHEPSLKMIHAFLDVETRKALSLPLAAVITGALSQVESTIELTNRICDAVFYRSMKGTAMMQGACDSATPSANHSAMGQD
jgi:hypothetical protein